MIAELKKTAEHKMQKSVEALQHDLAKVRTGRAHTGLLDHVMVDYYGSPMPINQVATVSAPEPRMLSVQVWDRSNVGLVEKAIRQADLGINPITDGQNIRLPIPDMTEERRKELSKLAHQYAEKAKIAVRNVRRDANEKIKKLEKEHELSEDDMRNSVEAIQKLTDQFVHRVDESVAAKEKEILEI